eukprot:Plantae.Rhodophyta-Purpureofilum_apyrenoidigerum.ctg4707.p1 GENE.Plantae.Rhodophyta-Purpureofilum_apyrenoidigerum.ctg4707~~Plantae.Rhodophyta-Purpureofilum_apyrenoidigerum.ctg4707.p1  ORF type:complete len:743 (+),score=184.46 Plantae.Rhodophyta-Purpureofilum_apyrenoidigerum.ctg4707:69-2231(+)
MAFGRTFRESIQKAFRSLETGRAGWAFDGKRKSFNGTEDLMAALRIPSPDRIFYVANAFEIGLGIDEIYDISKYDPWFLNNLRDIYDAGIAIQGRLLEELPVEELYNLKSMGFSDKQLAYLCNTTETEVRKRRKQLKLTPSFKRVDTCAAEFEAYTPYLYSTYDSGFCWGDDIGAGTSDEVPPNTGKSKIVILGGGPNRIGQGIEFDYCCVHACFELRENGFETIMINSNPETVSTDYDTSDRLYFEPLTLEDVIAVLEVEKPDGIIVQFGGQTPLKLAVPLQNYLNSAEAKEAGLEHTKILGTSPDSIDTAEDRDRFADILRELNIRQPANGIVTSFEEAKAAADSIGYPVVVRPSYVLGGRGMEIVYNEQDLSRYMGAEVVVESEHPVLIDRFLTNATEVDVDALADKEGNVVIGGIMEHIEEAGIHSGDSACSLPTVSISYNAMVTIRQWSVALAKRLNVVGLMNIQWAVQGEDVYILEANPRASRTVPFVSKAIGTPLAKLASRLMAGSTLKELNFLTEIIPRHIAVKEAVLPFAKFQGADIVLSPEMRSTGEVMGIDTSFGAAFFKSQIAAGLTLPKNGTIFMSMNNRDKPACLPLARDFIDMGYKILATRGTYSFLIANGLNPPSVELVLKVHEGRPNVLDQMKSKKINLFILTPDPSEHISSGREVRRAAVSSKVPVITTVSGARAAAQALRLLKSQPLTVQAMQDYHPTPKR